MTERYTIEQIRAIGQPPSITGRRSAEHWTASLYLRRFSPYVTKALLPTGISANGVTGLMILTGWATAAALLIPGLPGAVLAALLAQLQMLVDASDGEVARVRGTSGASGVFLDKIGHYTTEGLIPIALGVRAAGGFTLDSGWILAGTLLAVLLMWNKALNDMAESTRYLTQLPKIADSDEAAAPQVGALNTLRNAARFVPFHRIYHSVEMTLLILVAAVGDALLGDLTATRVLVVALLPLAALSTLGHAIAILASSRLK
ncbi:MAG: CDP-alcohol phosphatidyltransferase family protein [Candidatus Nanopelagicales bacterium]